MRAVLSIGSNMEDRVALLATVFEEFEQEITCASRVYATPPWGVEDQDDFLNAIVVVDVECSPLQLLRRGQALENAAQRRRIRHWGPRTLDVDVVQVINDGAEIHTDDPVLTLPHPYAHQRGFVLVPWLSIDPDACLRGKRVADIVAGLPADEVAAVRPLGTIEQLLADQVEG